MPLADSASELESELEESELTGTASVTAANVVNTELEVELEVF